MHDLNQFCFQVAMDLKTTSGTAGGYKISACFGYCFYFIRGDARGQIRMFPLESPSSAATYIRTLHLHKFHVGDKLQQVSRFFSDSLAPQKMTRIMIGYSTLNRSEESPQVEASEVLRYIQRLPCQ